MSRRVSARTTIVKCLRSDARMSLRKIGQETGISMGALARAMRAAEKGPIVRYVSILAPQMAGFSIIVHYLLKSNDERELLKFLDSNPNVNSCTRLADKGLFAAECFFRDMKEMEGFIEGISRARAKIVDEAFVTEDLKREGFMCKNSED